MLKRLALVLFLSVFSTPALTLTYHEAAKICIQIQDKVSIRDCVTCIPDTIKYCSHLNQEGLEEIGQCLIINIDNLSKSCRKIVENYSKP